jgi:hypothetical protein
MRFMKRFGIGRARIDAIFEIFNLFNHENYGSYVTVEANPRYREPQQNTTVSYQPRVGQLGFRITF